MAPKKNPVEQIRASGRARKKTPVRKPGSGNGKNNRTPQQLERQEKAFTLSVRYGKTIRQIAAELQCTQDTVISDIRAEEQRRADEIAHRRENEKARAIAFYDGVIAQAQSKSELYDTLLAERAGAKVTDHTLDAMLKARERQDKILGIDAPTKVEIGVQSLLDALNEE